MRINAKTPGIACSVALALSVCLPSCAYPQGAASEEELAQQVTYQDADTKPQTQPKAQDTQKDSENTKSNGATTQKNKSKKKSTGSQGSASKSKKSGSGSKK